MKQRGSLSVCLSVYVRAHSGQAVAHENQLGRSSHPHPPSSGESHLWAAPSIVLSLFYPFRSYLCFLAARSCTVAIAGTGWG